MLLSLASPSWASSTDDTLHGLAEARGFIASGEYEAATSRLRDVLRDAPANVDARLLLGSLYLRELDGPSAEKEYRRARELGAPASSWLAGYARALVLQGDFSRLLAEVHVADGLDDALVAEVYALRGDAHLALGETEQAGAAYDRALAFEPAPARASIGKARLLLAAGDAVAAKVRLDEVIARHPGQAEALLVRADLHRRAQDLQAAGEDYAAAAAAQPNNARAQVGLALVSLASRDLDAAQQAVDRLRELAPGQPVRRYLQALLAFQQGDLDRAAEELQVLLRAAPGNLQAQLLYGIVGYGRNEFTIADDYLTRVLASAPGNLQIVKLLGAARLKLRQPDRAVEVLAPMVGRSTDDAQLLALLGTAYLQSGDNTRGAEYIERAVELDPDQALLRTQLAVGKIASGDTGAAISQLESAVALGQDVIQADVLLVLSYLNRREYDKAIEASTALETRMPDSPIPFNLTGLAYLAQRDFDTAVTRFERALEIDPDFLAARMNLARLAQVAQRPADAERAYRAVLAQDPTHLGAMLGLAALARTQGDAQGAEDWLVQANRAHPAALQPVLQLAEIELRRNEGRKAVGLLSGIGPQQAQLPEVLRLRGMAQLQSGDFTGAVFTFEQLTGGQPESIEAWFQLARAHAARGDNARSRAAFERAIALDPEHRTPVVWIGLGELELRDGRFDAALVLAERIGILFPDNVAAYDIAAAAHRGRGDVPSALAAEGAALELDTSSLRVTRFARALAASGGAERAIQVLNDWVGAQPEDGAAWSNLGLIEQQLGHEEAALNAYEQAVRHVPPDPVILNNMAWLYTERDPQRAVELATRAYELAPSRAEIVDTYGWVPFQAGRRDEGLAALQQALIIAPRNVEIALHVAEALIGMRRGDEARPMLERVLRDHPGSPFAESARRLLDREAG